MDHTFRGLNNERFILVHNDERTTTHPSLEATGIKSGQQQVVNKVEEQRERKRHCHGVHQGENYGAEKNKAIHFSKCSTDSFTSSASTGATSTESLSEFDKISTCSSTSTSTSKISCDTSGAADELKLLSDRGILESRNIESLSKALWGLTKSGAGSSCEMTLQTVLSGESRPVREATAPHKLPESCADLSIYLKSVIRSINRYDIEASDYNEFKRSHSLGFRTFLCAMVLIDRIFSRAPAFALTKRNICRVTALCMMLISKFSEDEPLNNKFWSQIAAIPLYQLNKCELELVQLLNYELRVRNEQFEAILDRLTTPST